MSALDLGVNGQKPSTSAAALVDDYVYLAGRPPLRGYLRFMTDRANRAVERRTLVEEWRAAAEHVRTLEPLEGGWADNPSILPLDDHLQHLRAELYEDAVFLRGFDKLPTEVAVVELDRLVVYQRHINLRYVDILQKRLGRAPSDEDVFRFCLPADHPHPETRWMEIRNNTWACVSPSNDLRFLDTVLLEPSQIMGIPTSGPLSGVVGVMVGYGSNFLNVIHAEGRLILNNGSHRAYALRNMGFARVPCVVQHYSSRDEFGAVGASVLRRNPDLYLKHPRPPLLKDYFDPQLRKIVPTPRRTRQVRVTVEIEETDLPALG
jgi:hypothetical protein